MKSGLKIFLLSAFSFVCLGLKAEESLADRLRSDVEFLSDSLCAGRGCGTAGGSGAAIFIYDRFRDWGLKPEIQPFKASDSIVGHNVISGIKSSGSGSYIIVMAYYDGLGICNGKLYPGADSNGSGTAALLELAESLRSVESPGKNLIFVAVDGHNISSEGALAFWNSLRSRKISPRSISMVVNLDIVGNNMNPVERYWKDYLIVLGGSPWRSSLEKCNDGLGLHLYYDYYGSRRFTDLFYRQLADHRIFLENGIPCVMFTSGISDTTNKVSDTAGTLNYDVFSRRVSLICKWIAGMLKFS